MSDLPEQAQQETAGEVAVEPPQAGTRFSVGIDLGTTHCVLSYADLGPYRR